MTSALVATGGTIAWHEREDRMLSGAELASRSGCTFDRIVDVTSKPSWDLTIDDMEAIARAACACIDDDATSVVVTHGTDTLEETAWLTELLLGADRRGAARVTFTGAMRVADHEAADGPANLALAASSTVMGEGVRVAFAGRVIAARSARKIDTVAPDAFNGDLHGRPPPEPSATINSNVALIKVGPLSTPPLPVDAAGLVLEGTGKSHVPSDYHAHLRDVRIPVVLATRVSSGHAASHPGRFLSAGDLTAEKAALALMVALGTTDPAEWWRGLV